MRPGGALDFVDARVQSMLPIVAASDVAAVMNGARVGGALVSIAVAWKLLGQLKAWTLDKATLQGDEENDKCPADAPKGHDAVGPQSFKERRKA